MRAEKITVLLSRANPTGGGTVPDLDIATMPDVRGADNQLRAYEIQALRLVEAFYQALPGALIDRILIRFLEKQKCQLLIPYTRSTGENP